MPTHEQIMARQFGHERAKKIRLLVAETVLLNRSTEVHAKLLAIDNAAEYVIEQFEALQGRPAK